MDRRQYLTAGAAALAALAGCTGDTEYEEGNPEDGGGDGSSDGGDGSSDGSGNSGGDAGSDEPLEIESHELIREDEGTDYETVKVKGVARNVSGKQLSYAEIRARFYDADDVLLESFLDNVNDLGADTAWRFEVMYPKLGADAAAVASYEIGVGSSY